ncbi:hypothetical protein EVG20_g10745 [Dentipellis fragilis]|uniref:MYND-type domain-containing protein n=1 Tax=Dentipellis fragilis TaxID=205917 RepID=A0A4Y9XNX7_9AGAM|nr:hypothetical protein EVG20_g10745 [Dentipellis fragilis]
MSWESRTGPDLAMRYVQEMKHDTKQFAKVIGAAREGDLISLKFIATFVLDIPDLQTEEVLEILLSHLSEPKAIQMSRTSTPCTLARVLAKRAHTAMSALGQFGAFLGPTAKVNLLCLAKGWTGVLRWMSFFYEKHKKLPVRADRTEQRENSLHMVAYALYAITQDSSTVKSTIPATPGVVALATRLWLSGDPGLSDNPPYFPVPACTAALCHVLETVGVTMLDEVISMAGGAGTIAETALGRLRSTLEFSTLNPQYVEIHIRLLFSLTAEREETSTVRHALIEKGCIKFLIRVLLRLSTMPLQLDTVMAVSGALICVANLIEAGDAVTDLRLAVQEGMLQAFANLSPSFPRLHETPYGVIFTMVSRMVPKYLIYRSVLLVVQSAMSRMTQEDRAKVAASPMRDSWDFMDRLVAERLEVNEMVSGGTRVPANVVVHCDYVRARLSLPCHLVHVNAVVHERALKSAFKTCSQCHAVYYCSKECQVAGWRKSHKTECQSNKQELTGKIMQRKDRLFLSHLLDHGLCRNQPHLRRLAAQNFPGMPLANIGVTVDYTYLPEDYSVFVTDEHNRSREGEAATVECLIPTGLRCTKICITMPKPSLGRGEASISTPVVPDLEEQLGCSEGRGMPPGVPSYGLFTHNQADTCHIVLYCSKECQVAGWKNGHKVECKRNQEEMIRDTLQKEDRKFLSYLALCDAWHHLPRLRRLAAQDLPGTPLANIRVQIKYACVPEMYAVLPLASESGRTCIEYLITVGERCVAVRMISPTSLWEDVDFGWSLEISEEADTILDDVDIDLANMRVHGGSSVYRK